MSLIGSVTAPGISFNPFLSLLASNPIQDARSAFSPGPITPVSRVAPTQRQFAQPKQFLGELKGFKPNFSREVFEARQNAEVAEPANVLKKKRCI